MHRQLDGAVNAQRDDSETGVGIEHLFDESANLDPIRPEVVAKADAVDAIEPGPDFTAG